MNHVTPNQRRYYVFVRRHRLRLQGRRAEPGLWSVVTDCGGVGAVCGPAPSMSMQQVCAFAHAPFPISLLLVYVHAGVCIRLFIPNEHTYLQSTTCMCALGGRPVAATGGIPVDREFARRHACVGEHLF